MITLLPTVLFACFCVSNTILGVPVKQQILVSPNPLPQEMKSKLKSVIEETANDMEKASKDTENKYLDASLSEPKLKKTFNDVEIPLKKVSKGPKTLRQSTDILNAIKATLKGTDVSFSEKKDNIKELNKMTVKKKLINEKKRVNVKETTARNKETLKNEGDALNKIDETQKVSNVLNQTQKDILDKMLIHVKQASIGKKKKDDDKDDGKEKYYPGYSGYGYSAPVYNGYGYSAPGVVTTTHTYYSHPYSRRKSSIIGSTIAIILFCCAIFIGFALVTNKSENEEECSCCEKIVCLWAFCQCMKAMDEIL